MATIQDTILSLAGIKVGMKKRKVFSLLGFPDFNFEKNNFSLILCHASIPYNIWYKRVLNPSEMLESLGYSKFDLTSNKPNMQILIHFRNGMLEYFYLDPWIGYGDKGGKPKI